MVGKASTTEMERIKSARVMVLDGMLHCRPMRDGTGLMRPTSSSGLIMMMRNAEAILNVPEGAVML